MEHGDSTVFITGRANVCGKVSRECVYSYRLYGAIGLLDGTDEKKQAVHAGNCPFFSQLGVFSSDQADAGYIVFRNISVYRTGTSSGS